MENNSTGMQVNIRCKEKYVALRRLITKWTVYRTSMLMETITFFSQTVKFFEKVYNDSNYPRDRELVLFGNLYYL